MEFLKILSDQGGILGTLLVLAILAIIWLTKALLAEKDKRILGAEKVRDDLATPLAYIRDSLDLLQQKVKISKKAESNEE